MVEDNIIQDFVNTIKSDQQENTKTYLATVSRVESDGSVFVRLAGSDIETPTAMTSAEVSRGDIVNVEWRNNKLYIAGNSTNPSVGVVRVEAVEAATQVANEAAANAVQSAGEAHAAAEDAKATAESVHDIAVQASEDADDAKEAAGTAKTAADTALVNLATTEDVVGVLNWITAHGTMVSQAGGTFDPYKVYFIVDPTGDYVVSGTHYSVVPSPVAEDIDSYYILNISESVQNYVATHIVVDSEGLWIIPDAGGNKVLIATGSGSTYTTAGTYIVGTGNVTLASFTASGAQIGKNDGGNVFIDNDSVDIKDGSTVVATFGINGSQIGQNGQSRIIEDAYSMQMIDKEHHNYLKIKDLRGESGIYEFQESFRSDGVTTYYGLSLNAIKEEGVYQINVTFFPSSYHYSGTITRYQQGIEFDPPVPAGYYIRARYKSDSSLCKEYTFGSRRVYGDGSSDQVGPMSAVIGISNSAEAFASCGEGYATHSRGKCSHAEGWETYAGGAYSHSQNLHTYANGEAQTAIGKWNIADDNDEYALIVGNGSQGTSSNALTVDWSGNVEAAGDVTDGAGNVLSNKRSAAWVQMYHGDQAMNNTATKITGLTISQGGNYDEYFNVGTANQVTIKKTGGYRIDMAMRFSSVTNAANVKRIALYKNGSSFVALMARANSWEDFSTFYTQTLSVGDVLTMYGRSEDGNATASIERIYITPIVY